MFRSPLADRVDNSGQKEYLDLGQIFTNILFVSIREIKKVKK